MKSIRLGRLFGKVAYPDVLQGQFIDLAALFGTPPYLTPKARIPIRDRGTAQVTILRYLRELAMHQWVGSRKAKSVKEHSIHCPRVKLVLGINDVVPFAQGSIYWRDRGLKYVVNPLQQASHGS